MSTSYIEAAGKYIASFQFDEDSTSKDVERVAIDPGDINTIGTVTSLSGGTKYPTTAFSCARRGTVWATLYGATGASAAARVLLYDADDNLIYVSPVVNVSDTGVESATDEYVLGTLVIQNVLAAVKAHILIVSLSGSGHKLRYGVA